jgi:hypothetical protein
MTNVEQVSKIGLKLGTVSSSLSIWKFHGITQGHIFFETFSSILNGQGTDHLKLFLKKINILSWY